MKPLRHAAPASALALALLLSHGPLAAAPWQPLDRLLDLARPGATDITHDVARGPAYVPLPWPVMVGGRPHDAVLVGPGTLHLVREARPALLETSPVDGEADPRLEAPVLGPRLELLGVEAVQLSRDGRVLLTALDGGLAIRWTGLAAPGVRGVAIVEALFRPAGVVVQYLHVPEGLGVDAAALRASAFLLDEVAGDLVEPPMPGDLEPLSTDPPPDGCEAELGEWCDFTGPQCTAEAGNIGPGGQLITPCDERVANLWRFREGAFCRDCPYVFYILVECGREMHIPTYDMESLDLRITNMVTGDTPDLRCRNETAIGLGSSRSWRSPPNCPGQPGPWWSPPLDVTNNVGPGHVSFSDSTPGDGSCTTRFDVPCAQLPGSGEAPTVVYGEEQTIDCWIQNDTGLCGIYRVEIVSGGYGWELFANCDGTNTPQFDIYVDCTEAWADFNPLPELAIANVAATGDCYTYDVAFHVQNIGCVDEEEDVPVRIESDCGDVLNIIVPGPVPARDFVEHVEPFTLSCPDGVLTFTVDPDDVLPECTESPSAAACLAEEGIDTLDASTTCCPVVDAGSDKETCAGEPVDLDDASSQFADEFAWDDGGAGGTFTPSPDERNPAYTPPDPSPATVTLTLTARFAASGCERVDALELSVHADPTVDAGEDREGCAGEPVDLSGADPDAADAFSWSDGGAGGTFAPSAEVLEPTYTHPDAGTYTLELTGTVSATGCASLDALEVTVHPNPVVDAGSDLEGCAGDPTDVTGAAGGGADEFAWDDGGAGGTFSPSSAVLEPTYVNDVSGTYTLRLVATESATGCDSEDTRDITVHANPDTDAGSDRQTCPDQPVLLADADAGGADSFAWGDAGAGGEFLPSADVLHPEYRHPTPGTYTLTLTATESGTGCDTVDTLEVVVEPLPVVDAGAPKEACAGQDVALDDADGGDADTYLWVDNGAGGSFSPGPRVLHPTYSNPRAGFYTLELRATSSATGCEDTDTVEVDVNAAPLVSAGADKTSCEGVARSLDDAFASPGTDVVWDDGGAGGTFTPSATVLEAGYTHATPGTYALTLTATRPSTGCSASDDLEITVHASPAVEAGSDVRTCAGAPVALDEASTAATELLWDDGGAGGVFSPSADVLHPTYSNTSAGSYTLTLSATDTFGCTGLDTLQVTVDPLPVTEAGANREACIGQPVALSDASSDGATFAWDDGGGGGAFSPSATALNPSYENASRGVYTLTLTSTSTFDCVSSDSQQVTVRDVPVASFEAVGSPFCEDEPVCFDNTSVDGTSWSWSFGDDNGSTSNAFEPCFTYSEPGTYDVEMTVTNLCGSDTTTRTIVIDPKPVADFSFTTQGGRFCVDRPVDFTDESTNSPTSWQWDFDDGTTSTEQNPVHQFTTDGIFIVSLVACNECGCSPPVFKPVEIAATCQSNCEANSNQIDCGVGITEELGDTCADADGFNTTSYPCAPGYDYSGPNKTYDLNFPAGANFLIRIVETEPEPNGYELDIMISDACNPPSCVAWGDEEVRYDDRTPANDDFFLIVDGRDGTCGPFRLEIECLSPDDTALCEPPAFDGILSASDVDDCFISGILVAWNGATDWGKDRNGDDCDSGSYEVWRALAEQPDAERRVGTAWPPATSFVDTEVVPLQSYVYRVNAINDCCGEVTLTAATDEAVDDFGNPIEADAGQGGTLTCDEPEVGLLGSASGGTGEGFDFAWTPEEGLSDPDVPNPVATLPGVYTLTVTDRGDGCTGTDTVEVVGDQQDPNASAGPDRELTCRDPAVVLDGSASGGNGSQGYTYSWSPAGPLDDPTSPTPTTSEEGTYTLTVEAVATGCVDTDTVEVVRNDEPPTASAGPNKELTCTTTEVMLEGSASGGDGSDGYTYAWSPAAGLDDPSSPTPRTGVADVYTLTVTDVHTGCQDTDSVVVVVNEAEPIASAGPDRQLDCDAGDVVLDGDALGGDGSEGYRFAWSPPEAVSDASAEDPTTRIPGTYTLTVTDVHTGCTDTDEVVVTPDPDAPTADAGPDQEITCLDGDVLLAGSASGGDASQGYTYSWSPTAGLSDPDEATTTATIPGTYTLTVTSVADGCAGVDAVVVADLTGPPVPDAGADRVLTCDVTSVTLDGSAGGSDGRDGYTYAWEPADDVSDPSAPAPTTSTAGTYTLTVTDVYTGCSASDDVVVSEDLASPTAEAGPDGVLTCTTTEVVLQGSASGGNGSEGYAYSWSPPDDLSDPTLPTPTASSAGTYTLTVTDLANGCTDTDTVTVSEDAEPPVADAGPDQVLDCADDSVTLTGSASGGNDTEGYTYRWEPAGVVTDPDAATTEALSAGTYTLTVTSVANGCEDRDEVVVTSPGQPTADAGPDDRLTCDDLVADLVGSASGGDGSQGYTAEWSPAEDVADPGAFVTTTDAPGTYTLLVEDVASGCRHFDSMDVAEDREPPVASAGEDRTVTCDEPTVTLDGSASGGNDGDGYAYAWDPPDDLSDPTSPTPTTSEPGVYVLTVTAVASGCTDVDSMQVLDGTDPPVSDAGPDQVRTCTHETATLVGSASGGDGSEGFTYAWEPSADVSDPASPTTTATVAQAYTLTVTDVATGCTAIDTVEVTDDFAPPVADAGPEQVMDCTGELVRLEGSATGGNGSEGYDYWWEPSDDVSNPIVPNPVALEPGTYTLTVTDRANGCEGTDTVLVVDNREAPVAEAGPDQILDCEVMSVTLEGSATGGDDTDGYDYAWEPAAEVSDPTSPTPTTSTPGVFSLTVTARASGCVDTDTVTVSREIRAPIADAGPDVVLDCFGASVTLEGSARGGDGSEGYTYRWEPAANVTDPDAAVTEATAPGTYTLTVTSVANGCVDEDTAEVEGDLESPVADAGPDLTLDCDELSTTLMGSASGGNDEEGYDYWWEPSADVSDPTSPTPTASLAGTYTLTVTSRANGCADSDTMVLSDDPATPVASAGPDQQIDCTRSLVTLEGSASGGDGSDGYDYSWSPPDDLSNPGIAQPTTAQAGTYTLTVTDRANGCTDTDTVVVTRDVEQPVASAGPDQVVDCAAPLVTLEGSATGGNDTEGYEYAWEPSADVSDPTSPTPTTSTAQTYTLTVTASATGCTDTDTVVVSEDLLTPAAEAGPIRTITCATPSVGLQGSATGGNGSLGYSYAWEPAVDVSDPASATPTTSVAQTYTLTVTDLANGCTDTDEVTVNEDTAAPTANAGDDQVLDCSEESVTLTGSASGGNGTAGYAYLWEPAGGVTDPMAAVTEATAAGTYTLTVTDLANGCTDEDTVEVTSAQEPPFAEAGPDDAIRCNRAAADLLGEASGGDGSEGYVTTWSPTLGVDDPDAEQTTTTVPGTYTFWVEDVATGCRAVDTMQVADDREDPIAEAGPPQTITCSDATVTLQGSASGGNGTDGYDYAWTPAADVSDSTSPTPTTSVAQVYTLTVTDRVNGCSSSDTVTVSEDLSAPTAEAGADRVLGCAGPVTLDGSASGGNGSEGYDFAWQPAADVSDPTSPSPTTSVPQVYTLTVTDRANGCTHSDTVTVTDDATPPVASAGPDAVVDCAGPVTLQGSASGGNGTEGYDYSWEPAADVSDPSSPTPTTLVAQVYTLTVTDRANGCTDTDEVTVTEDRARPVAEAGPDAELDCAEESTQLSGSASGGNGTEGYAYRWEPAAAVTDPDSAVTEATSTGVFTLTVTDLANGCTDTDTAEVRSAQDPPVAEAGPDDVLTCDHDPAFLRGSASGGDGRLGYAAAWSPAADVADPTSFNTTTSVAGVYTLTVTDVFTGCRSFDTVAVTEDRAAPTAEAGPEAAVTCASDTAQLTGSGSGGNGTEGYRYQWQPSALVSDDQSATTTTQTPGTYTLTVTDRANGCTATDTVRVVDDRVLPTADAGPNQEINCAFPAVTLEGGATGGNGGAGYAYSWEPAGMVSDPTAAQPMTNVPGFYVLTVTDLANGCTDTDTVRVTRDVRRPLAEAGPGRVLGCNVTSVPLTGSASGGDGGAGYSYSWSPAADVAEPDQAVTSTSVAQTYTLTVTDLSNGCTDTDVVTVVEDVREPVATAGPDQALDCSVTSVTLRGAATGGNGSEGYAFAWSPPGDVSDPTAERPSTSVPGTYAVTVTDLANGCTDTDEVVVTENRVGPLVEAGPTATITCEDPAARLQGSASGGDDAQGYEFAWSPVAGLDDPTSATPLASQPGTYTLTVTTPANGCSASDTVTVADDTEPPVAEAGPDRILPCGEPGVTLQGSGSGGNGAAGYAFHWEPAGVVSDPDVAQPQALATGTFTLTVTALANGCTSTDTVEVEADENAPTVDAGPDGRLTCDLERAALLGTVTGGDGSQGFDVQWMPAAGVQDPSALVTTTTEPGAYTLLVLDVATGCRAADVVTIEDARVAPEASAGPDAFLGCQDEGAVLQGAASGGDGSAGFAFSWSPAGDVSDPTAPAPTTSAPGTYTLTVTDIATGCTAADTVEVTEDLRTPTAEAGPPVQITCGDPSPRLSGGASGGNGTAGYAYSWEPGGDVSDPTAPDPEVFAEGTFTLTVTDLANGCTAEDTVLVTRDPNMPRADAGPDGTVGCGEAFATLTGSVSGGDGSEGFTYRWEPATEVSDPNAAVTVTATPGAYVLTVTDVATGCATQDVVQVTLAPTVSPVEPSDLARRPAAAPLTVRWVDPVTRASLRLDWEDLGATAHEYHVYQGELLDLHAPGYDHERWACGLGAPTLTRAPDAGQRYFLVVATNCEGEESSYGRSHPGIERPDAATASGLACP